MSAALLIALLTAPPVGDVATRVVDGVVQIRWTTAVPARCRVEYGPTAALGRTIDEDPSSLRGSTNAGRDVGEGYANNHRADLPLPAAWPLHYRIVGKTAAEEFTGDPASVAKPAEVTAGARRESLELRLDRGGWTLPLLPITAGIPFPAGRLAGGEQVRVMAGGRELVSQRQVVTRWAVDGSVKWLRLSFIAPAAVDTVTVEYGSEVKPAAAPAIASAWNERTQTIELGGRSLPVPEPLLTDGQGAACLARTESVEVMESGPAINVTARRLRFVDGQGKPFLAAVETVHTYAGLSAVRVDFRLENDRVDQEMTSLGSLDLVVPGVGGPVTVGAPGATAKLAAGSRILQREDFEWVTEPSGAKGKRLEGIVESPAGRFVMRHFWEQYPAAVGLAADGLRLGLYPALPAGFYAGRKDEDKFYYYLRTGAYEFRQGFTKTHELWLDLSGDEAGRSLALDPPTAAVPPAWIESSGALRQLAVAVREQFPDLDQRIKSMADEWSAERERSRELGLMHYGDWYGERTWNWGNLEYDLGHAVLDQYARTGYAPLFHIGTDILRHQGDVDTRHYAADPRRIGQQWIHSMGHTGGYYPPDYKNMKIYASPGWSDNRGHVWAQGLLEHYLLGGDRRSWETGKLIADWAAGPQITNFRFGNAREPGWMTILVMSAYNATEDPYYLNAARLMLREVRRQSEATGGRGFYYHPLPGGHCDCEVKHSGEAGFMLAVLMTGMHMVYERTGDEQVADDIAKIAAFIVDTMWEPKRHCFRYTPCPQTSAGSSSTYILIEGLAFGAQRSGDPRLIQVARDALGAAWTSLPASGKSAGYALCHLPQGLEAFSRLPGPSFAEDVKRQEAILGSPARRPLPTVVPNGDFETDVDGYYARAGAKMERTTAEHHGGQAAMQVTGTLSGQNEYVVTRYDTPREPWEIAWLKVGETYRLTAWVKVVSITPGLPAPSVRLAWRDGRGTRGAGGTNPYDLNALGTWQKLTADLKVPDYNTRSYLALNTNTRESVTVELYLDDLSLVPVAAATAEAYSYLRLEPGEATSAMKLIEDDLGVWRQGPGAAEYGVPAGPGTRYLWLKVAGGGQTVTASLDGAPADQAAAPEMGAWVRLPAPARAGKLSVKVPAGARLGRVVVTDDPSQP